MSKHPKQPKVIDPDLIPEIICDGPFNIQYSGPRATLTMTHPRPKVDLLMEKGEVAMDHIVRARIATSVDNLIGLRDLLNKMFPAGAPTEGESTAGGATTRH